MRLVVLTDGTRDGRLHVVNADGTRAAPVPGVTGLQDALERWEAVAWPDPESGAAFDIQTAGQPQTPFLQDGETVSMWVQQDGRDVFGQLSQKVQVVG